MLVKVLVIDINKFLKGICYLKNIIAATIVSVRITNYFEKEKEAFAYEHIRILELKAQGMCFCNLDNGGTGGVNFI